MLRLTSPTHPFGGFGLLMCLGAELERTKRGTHGMGEPWCGTSGSTTHVEVPVMTADECEAVYAGVTQLVDNPAAVRGTLDIHRKRNRRRGRLR